MKTTLYILIAVIVVAGAVFAILRFGISGDEDTWICDNGQWVKHGNPSAAQPTTPCGEQTTNTNNTGSPQPLDSSNWESRNQFANNFIKTTGAVKAGSKICTEMLCPQDKPCCNSCEAQLFIHMGSSDEMKLQITGEKLTQRYAGQSVGCTGDDCSLVCEPLAEGKTYAVVGTLRTPSGQNSFYTLELQSFEEVKDQQADPDQFNWSTMNQGPYKDQITYATSIDLFNWTPSGDILASHASVPGAVVKDGTIYVYYVDVSTDGIKEQLGMKKSPDGGKTWSEATILTIAGLGDKATADPAPVLLADGRIRLFYFDINEVRLNKTANGIEPTNKIYSAISTDGLNFEQEDGVRFERQGIFDPDVEKVGDTWYLYGGDIEGNKVIVATSTDGLIFTEKGVAFEGGAVPDVWVGFETWFLFTAGIDIATSTDGLTFISTGKRFEDRDRGGVTADPSVVKLSDGTYLMLYKVKPLQ
ncbi:MAG: hypothetical protein V1685_07235 [Parcubacteria group bacterium]